MSSVFSRGPVWAWLPVFLTQGLRVRATTPRLPEAKGTSGSTGESDDPLRLVVVGDSVAAGIGLDHNEEALTGQVARALADRTGRSVQWEVHALGGLCAGDVHELVHDTPLGHTDVVVLSVGVNDTKDLHTLARWRREYGALVDHLERTAPQARIVVLPIPPMERFPALPHALGQVLGARSARVDAVAREVIGGRLRVVRADWDLDVTDGFASDGFHPGEQALRPLAEAVADAAL